MSIITIEKKHWHTDRHGAGEVADAGDVAESPTS